MKKTLTKVRTKDGLKPTRLWAEFSHDIAGSEYFFKVTSRLKGKGNGDSPLVLTECSTGYRVCDVPFTVIAATRVSDQENDYAAAGKQALITVLSRNVDFGKSIEKALRDIQIAEQNEWDDDIPF